MSSIGIIVNPFSGKDLRRLTAFASNVGNNEKVSKVVRMINCMKEFGIEKVYLMPDNYLVNASIASIINKGKDTALTVELLDFIPTDQPDDTIKAVDIMISKGIKCLIVLGGDGTCRLVAKTDIAVPIIPVSTGTNNVYPEFWEGTVVGIAASYIAMNGLEHKMCRGKRIEVYIDNEFTDIALVDAVITNIPYVGSRVVTKIENVKEVVVSRCSPNLIGLSSIVGCVKICEDVDEFGYRLKICEDGTKTLTSISPGQLVELSYSDLEKMELETEYIIYPDYDGTIALDGERTVSFRSGCQIKFIIARKAPYKANVSKMLYEAVENGFFAKPINSQRKV